MFDSNLSYSTLLKNPPPSLEMYKYNPICHKDKKEETREKKNPTQQQIEKKRTSHLWPRKTHCILSVCFLKNILKLCFKALAESTKPSFYC